MDRAPQPLKDWALRYSKVARVAGDIAPIRAELETMINGFLAPRFTVHIVELKVMEDETVIKEFFDPYAQRGFKIKVYYGQNSGIGSGLAVRAKETAVASKINQALGAHGPWGVF